MANMKRVNKNLDMIARFPETHWQDTWVGGSAGRFDVAASNGSRPPCGTTLCFAGWDAFLNAPAGSKIDSLTHSVIFPDGSRMKISRFAEQGMELTYDQAAYLFYVAETFGDLRRMADLLECDPDTDFKDILNDILN
jgi:hypothetical protein